jgi:hypothetical protein
MAPKCLEGLRIGSQRLPNLRHTAVAPRGAANSPLVVGELLYCLRHILDKLDCRSRAEAVRRAGDLGLLTE